MGISLAEVCVHGTQTSNRLLCKPSQGIPSEGTIQKHGMALLGFPQVSPLLLVFSFLLGCIISTAILQSPATEGAAGGRGGKGWEAMC